MAAPGSVLYSLLVDVQNAVSNLGLTDWNSNSVPVYLRKLSVIREDLESVPCVVVCFDDRPETSELADFEGNSWIWYRVEVGLVLPGDGSATQYQDYFAGWRQQIRRLFQIPGVVTLPIQIVQPLVDPKTTYKRGGFENNYDENLLSIRAMSYEPAS